jgi:hypothetical protein
MKNQDRKVGWVRSQDPELKRCFIGTILSQIAAEEEIRDTREI